MPCVSRHLSIQVLDRWLLDPDAGLGPQVQQQLQQFVISSSWDILCTRLLPLMTKGYLLEVVGYLGEIQMGRAGAVGGVAAGGGRAVGAAVAAAAGRGASRGSSGRRGRSLSREKDGRGYEEGRDRNRSRERRRGGDGRNNSRGGDRDSSRGRKGEDSRRESSSSMQRQGNEQLRLWALGGPSGLTAAPPAPCAAAGSNSAAAVAPGGGGAGAASGSIVAAATAAAAGGGVASGNTPPTAAASSMGTALAGASMVGSALAPAATPVTDLAPLLFVGVRWQSLEQVLLANALSCHRQQLLLVLKEYLVEGEEEGENHGGRNKELCKMLLQVMRQQQQGEGSNKQHQQTGQGTQQLQQQQGVRKDTAGQEEEHEQQQQPGQGQDSLLGLFPGCFGGTDVFSADGRVQLLVCWWVTWLSWMMAAAEGTQQVEGVVNEMGGSWQRGEGEGNKLLLVEEDLGGDIGKAGEADKPETGVVAAAGVGEGGSGGRAVGVREEASDDGETGGEQGIAAATAAAGGGVGGVGASPRCGEAGSGNPAPGVPSAENIAAASLPQERVPDAGQGRVLSSPSSPQSPGGSASDDSSDGDEGGDLVRVPLARGTAVAKQEHGRKGLEAGVHQQGHDKPQGEVVGEGKEQSSSSEGGSESDSPRGKRKKRQSKESGKRSGRKHEKKHKLKNRRRREEAEEGRRGKRRKRDKKERYSRGSSLSRSGSSGLLEPADFPFRALAVGKTAGNKNGDLSGGRVERMHERSSDLDLPQQQGKVPESQNQGSMQGVEEGEVVPSKDEVAALEQLPARVAAAAALPHMTTNAAAVMWQVKLPVAEWVVGGCEEGECGIDGIQRAIMLQGPAGQVLDELACLLCRLWTVRLAGKKA